MAISMPAAIVLVVCKTALVGAPDQNATFTGAENRDWVTEGSMMICRRHEVQLYDQAVEMGAAPRPFTPMECQRSGAMAGAAWDQQHRNTPWRLWRVACPTPIINTITEEVIGYVMPDCGHRDTVRCERDSVI